MRRDATHAYETMAAAIAYLRAHAQEQPGAAEVATAVGMSRSRFEHAFRAWVGTTPKRFLAYLTKERARELLAGTDLVRASHRAGLSGPGRLHDLLVTLEAVSPGELKRGFAIRYGVHPSPFGWCAIGITARGICHLSFLERKSLAAAREEIAARWLQATLNRDDAATARVAKRVFAGGKATVQVRGTNFQVKVWEALLRIPPGRAVRYADVARAAGAPKAVRAVGSACGRNGVAYLIPCHRVLAGDGGLGGYRWGMARKEAMLVREISK